MNINIENIPQELFKEIYNYTYDGSNKQPVKERSLHLVSKEVFDRCMKLLSNLTSFMKLYENTENQKLMHGSGHLKYTIFALDDMSCYPTWCLNKISFHKLRSHKKSLDKIISACPSLESLEFFRSPLYADFLSAVNSSGFRSLSLDSCTLRDPSEGDPSERKTRKNGDDLVDILTEQMNSLSLKEVKVTNFMENETRFLKRLNLNNIEHLKLKPFGFIDPKNLYYFEHVYALLESELTNSNTFQNLSALSLSFYDRPIEPLVKILDLVRTNPLDKVKIEWLHSEENLGALQDLATEIIAKLSSSAKSVVLEDWDFNFNEDYLFELLEGTNIKVKKLSVVLKHLPIPYLDDLIAINDAVSKLDLESFSIVDLANSAINEEDFRDIYDFEPSVKRFTLGIKNREEVFFKDIHPISLDVQHLTLLYRNVDLLQFVKFIKPSIPIKTLTIKNVRETYDINDFALFLDAVDPNTTKASFEELNFVNCPSVDFKTIKALCSQYEYIKCKAVNSKHFTIKILNHR